MVEIVVGVIKKMSWSCCMQVACGLLMPSLQPGSVMRGATMRFLHFQGICKNPIAANSYFSLTTTDIFIMREKNRYRP